MNKNRIWAKQSRVLAEHRLGAPGKSSIASTLRRILGSFRTGTIRANQSKSDRIKPDPTFGSRFWVSDPGFLALVVLNKLFSLYKRSKSMEQKSNSVKLSQGSK